jgi:site-specific DNA recombinase
MRAMLNVIDTIQNNRIQVLLARETFDPLMAPLKAWVASMELNGMRERMSMGVKARLRNGKANTRQDRYGYRRNGEVIEIVEEEARWVRKIFEWYNQGVKLMEIRERLIEVHTPQKGSTRLRKIVWAISSVQSILKAVEAYFRGVKLQSRDGEVFEIPAPPIIYAETYQRFLTVREKNVKHPMFNYRHDYLISGLLKCACGRKWAGRTQSSQTRQNRKGETVPRKTMSSTYCCTQKHKELIHEDCPRSIGHLKADDYVWGKVKDAIGNPEILIAGARDYVDDLRRKAQSASQDNERIQHELDNLLVERKWVITQARKGSKSEKDMDEQLAELS